MTLLCFWCLQDVNRPSPKDERTGYAYQDQHFGITRGQAPLLDVEPKRHVMCCLHLNLSIVGTLWKHGVLYHLSGPKKRDRADRLNARLKELSIHM